MMIAISSPAMVKRIVTAKCSFTKPLLIFAFAENARPIMREVSYMKRTPTLIICEASLFVS